jgi:outer membrane protein assembly factor BamD
MGVDGRDGMKLRPFLLVALLAMGCAHGGEPDIATLASNSDRIIFDAGQKALQKHQWDNARQHFKRIIDGFPQSEFGPAARLGLGDSYFEEGGTASSILAIAAYREFLTLYPSHPKSDYAQLQLAEAYYQQRNGPDRDATPTRHALEEFQRLLELYPNSPYAAKARQRVDECRQSLARSEFLAGYFYQRTRQACRAAILRYENLLKEFPDYRETDQVLYRLAECLSMSGRGPEALPHLARLLREFPQSDLAEPARRLMEELGPSGRGTPASAGPGPVPSPSAAVPSPPVPRPSPSA